jgi:hypothetical protein
MITVNTDEIQTILKITPPEQNIMLCGKHGIGKSQIITDFFTTQGMKVVPLFLGQMSDPGDLIGLPDRDNVSLKTRFLPPFWFPSDDTPVVLFLDELNRARPEVLQAIMDLALNRTLAGRRLPQGSRVISAVNYGDEYQLTDLDPALVSRFNVYCFNPTADEWLVWAQKTGIDTRVTDFIQHNKDALECFEISDSEDDVAKNPDRRGWVRVSNLIKGTAELNNAFYKAIAGIIGPKTTAKFIQFTSSSRLVSPFELLSDFSACENRIKTYQLRDLSSLNESLFRYFEIEPPVKDGEKNLYQYLRFLFGNSREALAHWMSFVTEKRYPAANEYLFSRCPDSMDLCNQFLIHWKK